MWRKRPAKIHPLVWQHRSGRRSLVLGATASHVEGMAFDDGRALLLELLDAVHRARARLPPRVGGRRPRHLGQPRRVAPGVPVRRVVGARHAPHDDRRRRADPMTDAERSPHRAAAARPVVGRGHAGDRPRCGRPDAKHQLPRRKGGPKGLNVLGTLAHHPALMHAYHAFNGHILSSSTLTPRERELLILRVGRVRDADYEWEQHVVLAGERGHRRRGDRARPPTGADAPGWSAHDAAMLRAVDELVADAMVSDVDVGGAGRDVRRPAADGPRLHRRRLRPAGDGVPVVRHRARRRPRASGVMSTDEAPADPPAATVTRRELAVARALDQARSRAENRVELFLDAARELMNTNSGEFTVQEVVDRSGQSLRTFYQYFAGKHELLLALFEESIRAAGRAPRGRRRRNRRPPRPSARLHRRVLPHVPPHAEGAAGLRAAAADRGVRPAAARRRTRRRRRRPSRRSSCSSRSC